MSKEKIRVGVVGIGMGKAHMDGFLKDERCELVAICDINEEGVKNIANEKGIQQTYTDAEDMFRSANLDAVSIAVPNCLHNPLTIAALQEGLHVLCEKPMAMTVAEAEEMKRVADEKGKHIMLNFSFRYHPTTQSLKQVVDAGLVGDIYAGKTFWHRRRGMPGFGGWFGNKELSGGGPLIDLGVHRLDLALWLMGYPNPIAVSGATYDPIARAEADKQGKHYSVEDLAMGFVRFDNGACLSVEASWAVNQKERELMETKLYGTKAGIAQRNLDQGYEFEAEIYNEIAGCYYTQKLDIPADSNMSAYYEFISSLSEGRAPTATADQGIKVQKILEGLYRSAEEKCEVRFD